MSEQMELFPVASVSTRGMSAKEAFEHFHAANPHVAEWLAGEALRLKRSGMRRYSIAGIAAVVRFNYNIRTQGDDYKLNNNHLPYYARLIMSRHDELTGFFELRRINDQ